MGLAISRSDFETVARLLYDISGIDLPESKSAMVAARLADRVRSLGLAGMPEYCGLVSSPAGASELENMLQALTTNITSFDRERRQLDHFATDVLPGLVTRARAGDRIRIWSAACSTGEEAFSLAFRVLSACPEAGSLDIKILATDIDRGVVAHANAATYALSSLDKLPKEVRSRNFEMTAASNAHAKVKQPARDLITFRVLNLLSEWPFRGRFDMIMCRNVAIYFDEPTQTRLWQRLADRLVVGGTLYIGHSENIPDHTGIGIFAAGQNTFQRHSPIPQATKPNTTSPQFREGVQ